MIWNWEWISTSQFHLQAYHRCALSAATWFVVVLLLQRLQAMLRTTMMSFVKISKLASGVQSSDLILGKVSGAATKRAPYGLTHLDYRKSRLCTLTTAT